MSVASGSSSELSVSAMTDDFSGLGVTSSPVSTGFRDGSDTSSALRSDRQRPVLPVLICGQARTFPFATTTGGSDLILADYSVSFQKLSQAFDLRFYLFLDNVDVEKTLAFFSVFGSVRELRLSDSAFRFLADPEKQTEDSTRRPPVPSLEHYQEQYVQTHNEVFRDREWKHPNLVPQFYRNLVAFDMLDNDPAVLSRAQYVLRMRPDATLPLGMAHQLVEFASQPLDSSQPCERLLCDWDFLYCGTVRTMRRCMRWLEIGGGCSPWQQPFHSKAYLVFNRADLQPTQIPPGTPRYRRWVSAPEGQFMASVHSLLQEIGEDRFECCYAKCGVKVIRQTASLVQSAGPWSKPVVQDPERFSESSSAVQQQKTDAKKAHVRFPLSGLEAESVQFVLRPKFGKKQFAAPCPETLQVVLRSTPYPWTFVPHRGIVECKFGVLVYSDQTAFSPLRLIPPSTLPLSSFRDCRLAAGEDNIPVLPPIFVKDGFLTLCSQNGRQWEFHRLR